MIGVNIDNLDKVIKINNLNQSSLDSNINHLIATINELEECYSGDSIHFAFSNALDQKDDLKKISNVVKNYSEVLSTVKVSYQRQDADFQNFFNRSDAQ